MCLTNNRNGGAVEQLQSKEWAGEVLRVSTRTLDRWAARGDGPPRVEVGGAFVGYRKASVLAWLAEREFKKSNPGMPICAITTGMALAAGVVQPVGTSVVKATTALRTGACHLSAGTRLCFAGDMTVYSLRAVAVQPSADSPVMLYISPKLQVQRTGGEFVSIISNVAANAPGAAGGSVV